MPPRSVQNPSKPVTDPTHKTPGQGTPGLAMHRPDTAVESDRLSGQARRGLDCARRVGLGVRAGGRPHRAGTHRGRAGGAVEGREWARQGVEDCAACRPRMGVEKATAWVAWLPTVLACTTLRPSRKGYGFGSPVTGAEQKPRPLFGSRLFRLRSTLHALWRAVWGLPQGGAGPVPVFQPYTVCRLSFGSGRGRFKTC